jgi:hypothetical protein
MFARLFLQQQWQQQGLRKCLIPLERYLLSATCVAAYCCSFCAPNCRYYNPTRLSKMFTTGLNTF